MDHMDNVDIVTNTMVATATATTTTTIIATTTVAIDRDDEYMKRGKQICWTSKQIYRIVETP